MNQKLTIDFARNLDVEDPISKFREDVSELSDDSDMQTIDSELGKFENEVYTKIERIRRMKYNCL